MGLMVAGLIITLWAVSLAAGLKTDIYRTNIFYVLALAGLQTYLYTGLFITAHDAMHGTVTRIRLLNKAVGHLCSFLYAGLFYKTLLKSHREHHKYPGTEKDPDYSKGNFFVWYFSFMKRYVSVIQIIIMAVLFNIFKLVSEESSIIVFWVIPALLSSVQLFYFGTYLPHKKPHTEEMLPHNSRTLKKNHTWAMLSCYFFGYHYEHHKLPGTPWWQLYKTKTGK